MSPAPIWQHQDFGSTFIQQFKNALETKSACACNVLYETDWVISEDTVVRPDVMIICEPIKGNFVTIPPSLILEILSPSTILKDHNTKFNLYQAYGVRYYLIADIGKKQMEVFHLKTTSIRKRKTWQHSILQKIVPFNFRFTIYSANPALMKPILKIRFG
jgi:Uma2 family endonuclease